MAAYDLGPVSRISMPSETRERKLGNLQRQQDLQLEPLRLAQQQQQIDVSKGNLALAQQQEQRMQQASRMQQLQQRKNMTKQVLQQVSENAYGLLTTTEEGSEERKRGMQGIYMQASDAFSQLSPKAKESFDAAVNQYGLDTLIKMEAQKYGSTIASKRPTSPKTYEISRPIEVEDGVYEGGVEIIHPVTHQRTVLPRGKKFSSYEDLPSAKRAGAEKGAEQEAKNASDRKDASLEDATAKYEEAASSNRSLAQLEALVLDTNTGQGAKFNNAIQNTLAYLGMPFDEKMTTNFAAFNSISMDQVAARINATKGAVSDMEMKLFLESVPSLATTPAGNLVIIEGLRQLNNYAMRRNQFIREQEDLLPTQFSKAIRQWDADQKKANEAFGESFRLKIEDALKRAPEPASFWQNFSQQPTTPAQPQSSPEAAAAIEFFGGQR